VTRTIAAGTAGDLPTLQDAVRFGGPVTGPGYAFHSLVGVSALSQRVELQARIPFVALNLGRFGRVPSTLTLAPWAHGVLVDRPMGGPMGTDERFFPSVGLGVLGFFDLVRFDVGRTLVGRSWMFSMDVTRDLWPVL
jgi:hypothetical protein